MSALSWPSPGVAISSARHEHRHLAEHLGRAAHAAAPAAELGLARRPRCRAVQVSGHGDGLAEHQPARTVEVAGEDVDHVDEPRRRACRTPGCTGRCGRRRRRARRRRARGRCGGCVSAGDAGSTSATASGVKPSAAAAHLVDAVRPGRRGGRGRRAPRRRARARRASRNAASVPGRIGQPLVGAVGGAGAARVDHDDLAAARRGCASISPSTSGQREQEPPRRLRVGAHDHDQ